jgi:putative hemolysin
MEPTAALILLIISLFVYCLAFQANRVLFSLGEEDLRSIWPEGCLPIVLGLLKSPRRMSLSLWLVQRMSVLGMVLGFYKALQTKAPQFALYSFLGISIAILVGRNIPAPGRLGINPVMFFALISRFAWLVNLVLGPVGGLLDRGSKALNRFFSARGGEPQREHFAQQELLGLVERGCNEGALEEVEHRMIHRVLGFRDRRVSRVMTPRADMFCLPADMGLDKAAQAVREAGYSRVPVYRESKDDVAGILYAKDLLRLKLSESENNASTLQELLRPAFFTPVNMELGELLEELRGRKLHMALCVDEYGAISGLVTMEDILEELFGEIYDEYDLEVRRWESMGEGVFMVSGKLGLHELEGLLGIRIVEEDCNTVAGLILKRLGHFPSQGEEVEAGMLKLRVEKVGPTRILAVRVQLTNQEEQ